MLYVTPALSLDPVMEGLVVSSLLIGTMAGSLLVGPLSDRGGRRRMLVASGVLYGVGALAAAFAPTASVLVGARVVVGLGVGVSAAIVPVYMSEVARAANRGGLSGLNQLMIAVGVLVAYLVSVALAAVHGWRWMFGLAVMPALLLSIGSAFLPESPRWLVRHGREDEARRVLALNRTDDEVDTEIEGIKAIQRSERGFVPLGAVLRSRRLRRILLIGLGLGMFQQLMGVNTIVFYAPSILRRIGLNDWMSIVVNAGIGVWTVFVTVVMLLFIVDKVGRRVPLILGAAGMSASMLTLGVLFMTGDVEQLAGSIIAIITLLFFKTCFSLSWGGIVWILLGELFPLRIRGAAMGVAVFCTEACNFIVSLLFPTLLSVGSGATFLTFSVLCALGCCFAIVMVPETKGKTLEELEQRLAPAKTLV